MTAEAVALLERLVAFPTVAGESNVDLVDHVREHLSLHGVESTVIPGPRPHAFNLHAVVGPPEERGILLAAHTDVVAVEGQPWTRDPFRLTRANGRLYGRGTADMKGFVAAALAVVPFAAGRRLRRPLHLALSCDEELGCRGVGSLLDALAAQPTRPALCVVGEPTELGVAVRHKGKVARRVHVRGRACHSSAAPQGVNAVAFAARLIAALDEIGHGLAAERDAAFAVPHATLSVGPIWGGVSVNIVPDACTFDFELRCLPGQEPAPALTRVEARARELEREMRAVAPEAGIAFEELAAYPPLAPAPADAAVAAQVAALAGAGQGLAVDFGTEAGLYRDRLDVPVVVCGPGNMAQAHRADEYLEAEQLGRAEELLRRLVDSLAED
jgi:acetylornithine deacetylase